RGRALRDRGRRRAGRVRPVPRPRPGDRLRPHGDRRPPRGRGPRRSPGLGGARGRPLTRPRGAAVLPLRQGLHPAAPRIPRPRAHHAAVAVRPLARRFPRALGQYHFPRAKPPKAISPISRTISPIQKLQTIIRTMPMITRIPPSEIPPTPPLSALVL